MFGTPLGNRTPVLRRHRERVMTVPAVSAVRNNFPTNALRRAVHGSIRERDNRELRDGWNVLGAPKGFRSLFSALKGRRPSH